MKKKKNQNIIQMNNRRQLNIGFFIFFVILVYVLYFIVQYFVDDHITSYEVEAGSIVQDSSYTGLALRKETVESADATGVISYYVAAGDKVGTSTLVYSVDENGSVTDLLGSSSDLSSYMTSDNYSDLYSTFSDYMMAYSDMNYNYSYQLKNRVNFLLTDYVNTNALEQLQSSSNTNLDLFYAKEAGVIEFYFDGFEEITADEVTSAMLNSQSYQTDSIESNSTIEKGDPAYKLVNDERWDIVIAVDDTTAKQLEEMENVQVTFDMDSTKVWASVSIRSSGGQKMAVLSLSNSMVRFASQRYLDIKLNLDTVKGLKIPNTAIVTKDFYLIPKAYATTGGDSSSLGFLLSNPKAGDSATTFISPTIYAETDDYYYVSMEEDLKNGDVLKQADSTQEYTISSTGQLEGVYCINKGYTVFRRIESLLSSVNYTIVATDSDYGIVQFDFIALDASNIKEGQIVN